MERPLITVFLFTLCTQIWISSCLQSNGVQYPRVCIIGAGLAGLDTARYLQDVGLNFTILEATDHVGGTWYYDSRVDKNEYGSPLRTNMYRYLRTNTPTQTMELPGFPFPEGTPSFPSGQCFYNYVKAFAEHFDLVNRVKFLTEVVGVTRLEDHWKVKSRQVDTGEESEQDYDYVVIATGQYTTPQLPNIPGESIFKGSIIHSQDYRVPKPYTGKRVLVIGVGPSGLDIGAQIGAVCETLFLSHHSTMVTTVFPSNIVQKPDVLEFYENGVLFKDGTFEEVDDVIYCTGYLYGLPFLDKTAKLNATEKFIVPLHQQIVNINEPTMLFVGISKRTIIRALDSQAHYIAQLVAGRFNLSSQDEMLQMWLEKAQALKMSGKPLSAIHIYQTRSDQLAYYESLASEPHTSRVPPVLSKIYECILAARMSNLYHYRDYEYVILDDETYMCHYNPNQEIGCSTTYLIILSNSTDPNTSLNYAPRT